MKGEHTNFTLLLIHKATVELIEKEVEYVKRLIDPFKARWSCLTFTCSCRPAQAQLGNDCMLLPLTIT
jgi:hypothetical protein